MTRLSRTHIHKSPYQAQSICGCPSLGVSLIEFVKSDRKCLYCDRMAQGLPRQEAK